MMLLRVVSRRLIYVVRRRTSHRHSLPLVFADALLASQSIACGHGASDLCTTYL